MILGVNKRQLTTARSCSCDVGRMRYQPTAMSGTGESGRLAQPSARVKFLATRRAARKPIFQKKAKRQDNIVFCSKFGGRILTLPHIPPPNFSLANISNMHTKDNSVSVIYYLPQPLRMICVQCYPIRLCEIECSKSWFWGQNLEKSVFWGANPRK